MKLFPKHSKKSKKAQVDEIYKKISSLKDYFVLGLIPSSEWRDWEILEFNNEKKGTKEFSQYYLIDKKTIIDFSRKLFEVKSDEIFKQIINDVLILWNFKSEKQLNQFIKWVEKNHGFYENPNEELVEYTQIPNHMQIHGLIVVGFDGACFDLKHPEKLEK